MTDGFEQSELEPFLAYLKDNGFPCGVGERVRATRVVAHFDPRKRSPRWKPLLCPIFARNPGEQQRFSAAFDLFFSQSSADPPPPVSPGQAQLQRPPAAQYERGKRRRALARYWPWLAAMLALIVVALWLPSLLQMIFQAPPEPPRRLAVNNVPLQETPILRYERRDQKEVVQDKRFCQGWECLTSQWRPWVIAAPAVLLALVFLLTLTSAWKRTQFRRRERVRALPHKWPPLAGTPRLDVYQEMLANAAQAMNKRLAAESERLDVPGTIRATIRRGGFPAVRFRKEQLLPEYLFLIEQRAHGDHFAAWWTGVADELRALGVRIACYYHGGDMRSVRSANGSVNLTVNRLLDLHPDHAVLMLGESATLLNPYSGELASWAAMLKSRENRAVLTPEASFEWGPADRAAGRHLTVLPARVRHLPAVLKSFDAVERTTTALALSESEETGAIPEDSLNDSPGASDVLLNVMTTQKQVPRKDFPEIYQKAGDDAARSQKVFVAWNLINLAVLTLAALVSTLKEWLGKAAPIISAVLVASGAAMTFWLRKNRYERKWYRSRAVAESIKTLSWRYMMCASPFEGGSAQAEAQAASQFDQVIHDIAKQEDVPVPKPHEITEMMKEVRAKTPAERASLYLDERIEDQREWYAKNSKKNETLSRRALYIAVATQVIALIFALLLISNQIPDLVGVFATVSASVLAWMQMKRYEDIAQAYLTAAKELSSIAAGLSETPTEAELSQFVVDAENAVSREHTLWLAKRS